MTSIKDRKRCLTLFLSAVTVIGIVFSLSTSSPSVTAEDHPDLNVYADQLGVLINEYREANGLEPLYMTHYMNDIANLRARESIEFIDEKHHRPDGTKWTTAIDMNIMPIASGAENFVANRSDAQTAMDFMLTSDAHKNALLMGTHTHMGIGVTYDPNSPYRWYWIVDMVWYDGENPEVVGQYLPQKYNIVPQSPGDINGDGVVDSFDYVTLTKYLAKKAMNETAYFNELQIEAADCLRDGEITYADAKILQKYLLGEIASLPFQL